ncbi:hypothetical protein PSA5_28465, partial [Pseudomonas syringae pv. actinidiae]
MELRDIHSVTRWGIAGILVYRLKNKCSVKSSML